MLNHLGGYDSIKQALHCCNATGVIIDTNLIKRNRWELLPCNADSVRIRLHAHHVNALGIQQATEGSIATTQIKYPARRLILENA